MNRLKHIWRRTTTHKSEVTCIYIFQLIFGLLIGGVFYNIINKFLGESVALEHLAIGFDRTVIMDVINSNHQVVRPMLKWMLPFIPIYLMLSIVLQGGFLSNIKNGEVGVISQIRSGKNFFFPFLSVAIISLFLIGLFIAVVTIPFMAYVDDPLITFSSEKPFVLSLLGLIGLISVWIVVIWAWSISTRLAYIDDNSFWKAIKHGISFIKNKLLQILAVGYLFVGLQILLSVMYYVIMGDRGAPSWIIVIFGIFVQQVFSFIRVYLRGMAYITMDQIEDNIIM